jgi:hypothetical protein
MDQCCLIPDGLLWIVRHEGQVEANQLRVGLDEGEGLLTRADFFGDAVEFFVEDVAEAFVKMRGRM